MSRSQGNKLYANFSRGMITEASYLAFPENATLDERNCDIQENGVRVRRYGYDNNGTWDNLTLSTFSQGDRFHTFMWNAVGEDPTLDFLVVQVENTLHFWNITGSSTGSKKGFTVDLETYVVNAATTELAEIYCQFSSGRGELFVAHRNLKPLRIAYDAGGDSISVSEVPIKIRDFVGLDDELAIDEEPVTLSAAHHYNLRNQGWIDPEATNTGTSITSYDLFGTARTFSYPTTTGPIAEYFTAKSRYPGNNKIWWSAKDSAGDFDPAALAKLFFGNTRAPRGHFIIDAFNRDRTAVSGIAALAAEVDNERPRAVEFYQGRAFWGHRSQIYFSPILEDGSRAGQCFQEADPTSENISDLLPTDGGVIELPHAKQIVRLVEMGSGLMVFATNGIWFIGASSQGFSASDYTISKVNEVGTNNARSIVKAGSQIYWWSDMGIHAMQQSVGQFGEIAGRFDQTNITETTIETFYNQIGADARADATGEYDPASQKVVWLYKDSGEDDNQYENMLWFDIKLSAFVPWTVTSRIIPGSPTTGQHYMIGVFRSPYFASNTEDETYLEFLSFAMDGTPSVPNSRIKLGNFVNQDYVDWQSQTFAGSTNEATYESYIVTGFEVLEDGLRIKQAPMVGVFFRSSEDTVTDEGGGNYSIDNPSSCFFQARWDWANVSNGNWSRLVQAYRPRAIPFVDPLNPTAASGYDVVYSRLKVRGSGRAVQFKLSESQKGHGFELLGWHVFFGAKTVP